MTCFPSSLDSLYLDIIVSSIVEDISGFKAEQYQFLFLSHVRPQLWTTGTQEYTTYLYHHINNNTSLLTIFHHK